MEEILHQLQETGGIVVEDGEARLRSAEVKVPATIHDIIAARVDRLAEPLKLTLRGASVVGRRFGTSLLSRVIEVPAVAVEGNLKELHAVDFVFPSAREPEPMYSFKHALTQDVVYTGLLERRRRRTMLRSAPGSRSSTPAASTRWSSCSPTTTGRAPRTRRPSTTPCWRPRRRSGAGPTSRPLPSSRPRSRASASMPDTEANRLRRIDAVIKQAEVKFALGRHAEHVEALGAS